MNCEEVRVLLEADGAADALHAAAREHLRACSECAQYAQTLHVENRILHSALSAAPDEARFLRVTARLAERLHDNSPVVRDVECPRARSTGFRRWIPLGAAAAAALAVGGWFVFSGRGDRSAAHHRHGEQADVLDAEVSRLQDHVRDKHVLDELEQLQIAFGDGNGKGGGGADGGDGGDAEARSAAEDAELYVERILSLDRAHAEQAREILAGIKQAGISRRLQEVRQSLEHATPAPVLTSLDLAAATLDQARSTGGAGVPARPATPAAAFAAADEKFRSGKYEEALESYRALEKKHPGDWRAAQARFTAAFILEKKLKRPAQARQEYQAVIDTQAASPIARSAEFHVANTFEVSGDTQKAIRGYERFLARDGPGARTVAASRKIESLRRKQAGLPDADDPPGWAAKLERKRWRKPLEKPDKTERPDDPGDKDKRPKQTKGF